MNAIFQTSAAGALRAARRFGEAADRIAAVGTAAAGATAPGAVSVDLTDSALGLIASKAGFEANVAVLKTADAITKRLLDVRI